MAVARAHEAFLKWRTTPGPVRGDTVRRLGNALRDFKPDLGQLVTLETGKIIAEGEGEVQEMIDICDFAVGQSRMLYGLTIQSERPSHRLMEQWHPLGVVAVISAFNFPVAVWSWNAALAAVCGDATVWKASEKTPLTAIAVTKIAERVCRETGADPAIFTLLMGDRKTVGQKLSADHAHSFDLRHRLDANGCACCANGPWPAGQDDHGTGRQQRAHRRAERRSRNGDAIDLFRRSRHGGSALHLHAARDHARIGRRQSAQETSGRIQVAADWKSARSPDGDGSLDREERSRHGAAFHPAIEGGGRRSSLRRRAPRGRAISGRLLHDAVPGERET